VKPAARLRRTYFDCRYGQLHVHQAIPPGGGFDEATALLCIPGQLGEGRFFQALLGPLGADRSIYAPDLPGCGQSDAPAGPSGSEQHALALLDLLDSLRQRRVDVLAHAAGTEVAVALAALRPGTLLRRVACSAPPPRALEALSQQGLEVRDVTLAKAVEAMSAGQAAAAQLHDLIEFFGAASPA
jgi:pimeloyl-ACP methyl ester carboxylesterase